MAGAGGTEPPSLEISHGISVVCVFASLEVVQPLWGNK